MKLTKQTPPHYFLFQTRIKLNDRFRVTIPLAERDYEVVVRVSELPAVCYDYVIGTITYTSCPKVFPIGMERLIWRGSFRDENRIHRVKLK